MRLQELRKHGAEVSTWSPPPWLCFPHSLLGETQQRARTVSWYVLHRAPYIWKVLFLIIAIIFYYFNHVQFRAGVWHKAIFHFCCQYENLVSRHPELVPDYFPPAIYNVTQFWWERSSRSLTAAAGGSCLPDMGSCWPLWKLTKGGSSVWSSAGEHGAEESRSVLEGQLKRRTVHLTIRSPEWSSAGTLRCPWGPASLLTWFGITSMSHNHRTGQCGLHITV